MTFVRNAGKPLGVVTKRCRMTFYFLSPCGPGPHDWRWARERSGAKSREDSLAKARSGLYQLGIREVSSLSGALVYLTAYVLLNPLRAFVTVNDPFGNAETLIQ